jgi:hypothetical protein
MREFFRKIETDERIAATDFKSELVVLLARCRRSGSEGWFAWTRRSSAGAGELSLCRWGQETVGHNSSERVCLKDSEVGPPSSWYGSYGHLNA